MGVKVREKIKGSGVWWVFVNHRGERGSHKVGSQKAALKVQETVEAQLKLGLTVFQEKKQAPAVPTPGELLSDVRTDIFNNGLPGIYGHKIRRMLQNTHPTEIRVTGS
jgi:hypothetical protein